MECTLFATRAIESTLNVLIHWINLFDDKVCVLLLSSCEHNEVVEWIQLLKKELDSWAYPKLLVLTHPVSLTTIIASKAFSVVN